MLKSSKSPFLSFKISCSSTARSFAAFTRLSLDFLRSVNTSKVNFVRNNSTSASVSEKPISLNMFPLLFSNFSRSCLPESPIHITSFISAFQGPLRLIKQMAYAASLKRDNCSSSRIIGLRCRNACSIFSAIA